MKRKTVYYYAHPGPLEVQNHNWLEPLNLVIAIVLGPTDTLPPTEKTNKAQINKLEEICNNLWLCYYLCATEDQHEITLKSKLDLDNLSQEFAKAKWEYVDFNTLYN